MDYSTSREIEYLLNLSFEIGFSKTEYSNGKPFLAPPSSDNYLLGLDLDQPILMFNDKLKYWEFSLRINDLVIENVIECSYEQLIKESLGKHYQILTDQLSKSSDSISPDVLKNYLARLEKHLSEYDEDTRESDFLAFNHPNLNVTANDYSKFSYDDTYIKYCLSFYLQQQRNFVKSAIGIIKTLLLKNGVYTSVMLSDDNYTLTWEGTDTDLLELIIALLETSSISKNGQKISRKEAIKIFEQYFKTPIKDAESKISRATERKMNSSPFLTSLKEAFDNYCLKKMDKVK